MSRHPITAVATPKARNRSACAEADHADRRALELGFHRSRTVESSNQLHGEESSSSVLIATVNRSKGDTGVHTHTRALADALSAAGVCCQIQSPFLAGAHWLPIFAFRRVLDRVSRTWGTRWYRQWHQAALGASLKRSLRENSPRAIIAQCPLSAMAALDARGELRLDFPIAMVCHFNFSEAREYRERGELDDEAAYQSILDFERQVMTGVDQVIYVSNWARQVVEQERGIAPRSARVIWNGIPTHSQQSPIARKSLGAAPDDLVLINVGTLEPRKNQIGLLDLFARIAAEYPSARLVLIGDGPGRASIEQKIMDLGLFDRVRLLGHRPDVPELLPAADLYVHYASLENCPVVLIEAARAALPIAALPGGGARELLDALGGIPLDPANCDRAFHALQPLLQSKEMRQRAGRASREAFERSFTCEAMASAYLDALHLSQPARAKERPSC